MNMTIACIGSGNMGTALMRGAAGVVGAENILFTDADRSKAEAAAASLGAEVALSNEDALVRGDFIFLAVKPQVLGDVLQELGAPLRKRLDYGENPVLVSMAAGWSIDKIQASIEAAGGGAKSPVVRIMPNTPALISSGVIALSPSPEVKRERVLELERILSAAGITDCLEERYLDGVTGLSGSGPAFVYLFIEALADGGVLAGLPRDKALRYAAQTVLGSARMVLETGNHPGELKDMVTSPGGTTIAGVAALENGAFRGIVMNAVEAAFRRAEEMARETSSA